MRAAATPRLPLAGLALALALALGACGKSAEAPSGGGGPTKTVAPLSVQGAVSVSTRNTTRLGGEDEVTDAASVARAVYPGLTTATRPQVVILVNAHNWPAALAASVLAAAPTGAPILFSEGDELPEASRQTLEAMHPLGSSALGGVQVVEIDTTAAVPKGLLARALSIAPSSPAPASGATGAKTGATSGSASGAALAARTEAAAAAAAAVERLLLSLSAASAPHEVIVVPAGAPPALTTPAAGLSAESGAPILLVGAARVPRASATVLASLHHPAIYAIDAAQMSAGTLADLRHFGALTTIGPPTPTPAGSASGVGAASGADERAAINAIAIARFTDGTFGWGVKEPGHGLVFANSARPLDGPGSALLSATANYGPLLLLESASHIPAALASYLGDIQPAYNSSPEFRPVKGVYNHGWLIGNEHAISAVTQSELDAMLQISPASKQGSEEPSVSQVE